VRCDQPGSAEVGKRADTKRFHLGIARAACLTAVAEKHPERGKTIDSATEGVMAPHAQVDGHANATRGSWGDARTGGMAVVSADVYQQCARGAAETERTHAKKTTYNAELCTPLSFVEGD
jgi:hypothetical protein